MEEDDRGGVRGPTIARPPSQQQQQQQQQIHQYPQHQHQLNNKHPASVSPYHHSQPNYHNSGSGTAPSFKPSQYQSKLTQTHVEPSKVNSPFNNPYPKRPSGLYQGPPTGYANYGKEHKSFETVSKEFKAWNNDFALYLARQEAANTQVLPEIAQPKPFEGYRRQPQPAVSRVRLISIILIRS